MTPSEQPFRDGLRRDLARFVDAQARRFPADECLVIDLHCHDHNSDVPDELLGRILHWPETWVSTDAVRATLAQNGATALTITNHNNARSCYALQDRGVDVLTGAEFTCTVPDFEVHVHVLTYGFTPDEEARLLALRHDLYRFLEYARARDLVTVLAHPLYFYSTRRVPPLALLEKLTLLFDHFEALNGQRDSWQNLLVVAWLESLSELRVADMARRAGIPADAFCRRPVHKAMTGGSDDHMALCVGSTGSRVHVPGLAARLPTTPRSTLVLEALRAGRVAPYGGYAGEERLAASFLDYFCQIVREAGDPGLVRLLLHQGTARQKTLAFLIANAVFELRRHRTTSRFIEAAHDALHGKGPGFLSRHVFAKEFRPLVRELEQIARTRRERPADVDAQLRGSIPLIFHELCAILAARIGAKAEAYGAEHRGEAPLALTELVESLEVPADLRALLGAADAPGEKRGMSRLDLATLSEGLPFPALAALVVGGATYASTRVLFANRPLLDEFSQSIGRYRHPRRLLWLTDAFADQSGVGSVLRLMHAEAVRRDLPIDFAVCHATLEPDPHLKVLRPVAEFTLPYYEQQPIRVGDVMALQRLFLDGGYDRVLCSTEGPMGLAALYLKSAFSVPAFFYLHTDWIDFARRTLKLDGRNTDRVRRLLRAYYRAFDGLFVLNSDHLAWLASDAMGIPRERLRRTAHWIDARFAPRAVAKAEAFPGVAADEPVVLYVGRISEEKGVLQLPGILAAVRTRVPNARLAVVGVGPAEERLRALVPDACFRPWLGIDELARVYPAADALVLPSRFDTFGCVVLEALACGVPAVAYRTKGPKDLIVDGECGFTVQDPRALATALVRVLTEPGLAARLRAGALARAATYRADRIVDELLVDVGLSASPRPSLCDAPTAASRDREDEELGAWSVAQAGG